MYKFTGIDELLKFYDLLIFGQVEGNTDIQLIWPSSLDTWFYNLLILQDGENVDIQLGVCWSGILVFREKLQINKFVWPKILKMSYRRKKFYIKLRTGEVKKVLDSCDLIQ